MLMPLQSLRLRGLNKANLNAIGGGGGGGGGGGVAYGHRWTRGCEQTWTGGARVGMPSR